MLIEEAHEGRGLCWKLRHIKCDMTKKIAACIGLQKKNNRGERLNFIVGTPWHGVKGYLACITHSLCSSFESAYRG